MRTLMILKGLPGCGKSTYAKDLLKFEPKRWKRVNRDDLRGMLDNHVWSKDNEKFVKAMQDTIIRCAFADGYDVIVDNTSLVQMTVKKLHRLAESIGDVKVIEKGFNVSVQECLRRNALREGVAKVPEKVIYDMSRASGIDRGRELCSSEVYYPPRGTETSRVNQDVSLPKAIICDLDGTLAIIGDRSPYDASECDVKDLPNGPVIEAVMAMRANGIKVVFMSAREDKYREQTVRFIEKHCRYFGDADPEGACIPYELYMRATNDLRRDATVKRELFDEHVANRYNVLFVLDDRNQVVDAWREMGLACFQVNYGDF
jgi:predicted kinase